METKTFKSKDYNWVFNKKTGFFARWGEDFTKDPEYSPIGPEIADIEISTICHGPNDKPCKFCYKCNTGTGEYMNFELYKLIIQKLKGNLTQVALGIGDIDSNPDLEKILEYTRSEDIVPNITINGYRMTTYYYELLAKYCGAVAVSNYGWKNCIETVNILKETGVSQVNIHQLICEETFDECMSIISKHNDKQPYNAIVFLSLKQKGRGVNYTPITPYKFETILKNSLKYHVPIGFDSCSANKVMEHLDDKKLEIFCEPCESMLFSIYVNTRGRISPCSFLENEETFSIQITENMDFMNDVWRSESIQMWRDGLIRNKRNCPKYII
jgi:hypothetical protein